MPLSMLSGAALGKGNGVGKICRHLTKNILSVTYAYISLCHEQRESIELALQ